MTRHRTSPTRVRCAIYTRKSTEEGLDQDFNSLDAQRESGEAFIKSQAHEGWSCLPDRFDDGGFTGGNMERPALTRLMAHIEAGHIDCVVVYKVDRLSRSLLDFARMMEIIDRHHVAFVSVTQQFNTASSMGRLILNVLLSFAQFEREMISERTRDKIAAARRKGKWSGGMPLLGYDVVDRKLVVNEAEAAQVQQMFFLYLEHRSLLTVVQEIERREWSNKVWTTRKGHQRGGHKFTKTSLHQLLTNVTYKGQVRHKREVFEGEQPAIVAAALFDQVQVTLHGNACGRGLRPHGHDVPLLRGLLRCASCDCAMVNSYASRGSRRYRYYLCTNAQKRGWSACPSPSVPAGEIERYVIDEIRCLGRDPKLVAETLVEYRELANETATKIKRRRAAPTRPRHDNTERRPIAERIGASEIVAALTRFENAWDSGAPAEQARLLGSLVKHVRYDGRAGHVEFAFHLAGIRSLAAEALTREINSP